MEARNWGTPNRRCAERKRLRVTFELIHDILYHFGTPCQEEKILPRVPLWNWQSGGVKSTLVASGRRIQLSSRVLQPLISRLLLSSLQRLLASFLCFQELQTLFCGPGGGPKSRRAPVPQQCGGSLGGDPADLRMRG